MSGRRQRVWAVIAGGGTGGHVYPGLAVAEALGAGDDPRHSRVHFVVSRRPLDSEIIVSAGFEATPISARGFRRRLTVANLVAAWALARGVWQCWRLLGRTAPRVVLAQGGYVSAACSMAARLRGIPVVVLEANATPGAANRLTARWASACAVAHEEANLRGSVRTGLPVRTGIAELHPGTGRGTAANCRNGARAALGVGEGRRLVLVIGGSQGSTRLNAAVETACDILAERADLAVRHVTGSAAPELGRVSTSGASGEGLHYKTVPYEHDMPTALAAADLVVSRAGGSALAELAIAGRASLLVPLPGATGDHQSANAGVLASAGASLVIPESELSGPRLATAISDLLVDPVRLERMQQAAAELGRPDAARRVAEMLLAAAGEGAGP
ncbi:MAG: UDP-N-acetylglucosamine--N-acetylmuramyl-(pentapeptide) pyrophosphoryl-undecaprenol N-acetylglucosamine transferase [Acidimicrobiia bacterium]|nr:UDP-N-acetylglucosamine--N-acetylmuramyl-(pentapeptide) pyrophosphoryl-undecaprenol N-acetylglucosamine transferase [Acidimicrobiia bacterium]